MQIFFYLDLRIDNIVYNYFTFIYDFYIYIYAI